MLSVVNCKCLYLVTNSPAAIWKLSRVWSFAKNYREQLRDNKEVIISLRNLRRRTFCGAVSARENFPDNEKSRAIATLTLCFPRYLVISPIHFDDRVITL